MREKLKQLKKALGKKRYYALTPAQRKTLAIFFGMEVGGKLQIKATNDELNEMITRTREEVWE